LTAEAHAEQRHARLGGVTHHLQFGAYPGAAQGLVINGPPRTEGDDDVVAGRIAEVDVPSGIVYAFGGHHLEGVDVEAEF
jgi:hypothetical protein